MNVRRQIPTAKTTSKNNTSRQNKTTIRVEKDNPHFPTDEEKA